VRTVVRRPRKRIHVSPLAVFAALVAVVLLILYVTGVFSGGALRRFSKKDVLLLPMKSTDIFVPFQEGVVYVDTANSELLALAADGKIRWGFKNATEDMTLHAAENRLGVVVSKKLQMLSAEGTLLYSKTFERPIDQIAVSDNLTVLALRPLEDVHTLTVLDSTGEILGTLAETTGQTILNFGIFGDASSVWVISADTSSTSPSYRFSTYKYDPKKSITAGFEDKDQMLYAPVFSKNYIYLCGTSDILEADYEGKVQNRRPVNGYQLIASGESGSETSMVLQKLEQDGTLSAQIKEIMVLSEKKDGSLVLPESALSVQVGTKYLYAFSNYNLYQIKQKDLSYHIYTLPVKADSIISCEGNEALVVSGEKVYLLQLPD